MKKKETDFPLSDMLGSYFPDVLHGGDYAASRNDPERVGGQSRGKHQGERDRHVQDVPRHGAHGEEVGREHRHRHRLQNQIFNSLLNF